MFGTFRTLLALAVMVAHLLRFQSLGEHAVHGFFILSGYLMTTIMQRNYGYSLGGVRAYAMNRFLRLYPTYWIILCFIVLTAFIVGENATAGYHPALRIPDTPIQWVENLSLIYPALVPSSVEPRLSPATWALTTELAFYALIAFGISRTKRSTWIWFALSAAYCLWTHLADLGFESRYLWLTAGSLPFSIGALCHHYEGAVMTWARRVRPRAALLALGCVFLTNAVVAALAKQHVDGETVRSLCAYVNLGVVLSMIAILMTKPAIGIDRAFDKRIGDFSYPIYLVHWQAGLLASLILYGRGVKGHSTEALFSFLFALLITACVSGLIVAFVDPSIEKLRDRIKKGASAGSQNP